MFYVIHLDHDGEYQGIVGNFKTLKEAKADIESSEVCGKKIIRIGRIGYLPCSHTRDEYSFSRVIVEIDMNLKKTTGKRKLYDPYIPPDEDDEPEKHEKFFAEIDRVLDILTANVSLFSDHGDRKD